MNRYLALFKREQTHAAVFATLTTATTAPKGSVFLSDLFGYLSFACWLFVLVPQLWLNYKRKSSDGLSLGFILMWLGGDFCDWFGAYIGELLLPTILIALYFVLTDVVLLAQMFSYRKGDESLFSGSQGADYHPLIVRRGRRACRLGPNPKVRLAEYGAVERGAMSQGVVAIGEGAHSQSHSHLSSLIHTVVPAGSGSGDGGSSRGSRDGGEEEQPFDRTVRAVAASAVVLVALVGSGVGSRMVLRQYPQETTDRVSQVFGYISAAMFFVAYIPQIAWNFASQSTEGLSTGMFIFTVVGNITYCLSILALSTEWDYIVTYAPWLIGAAGTIGFELLILWQCYFYSTPK